MTIAIDFVGTNIGSGTKTYNINFCNELESFELKEDVIIYISKTCTVRVCNKIKILI